ncbi:UDP-2,3-diacylglucosamine diphosphatase [Algibacillus agarilyticus]|uniref:UDP-2,3-diacylglucosamine diphosphatase n=1 Tax=Algibacillus agarilyticus TaxID=2234133 RepID=UPI000DCFB5DB|nr:UDP-2,3-diacylglucosamine diphosphatase [Algibacillus agarilyticus]
MSYYFISDLHLSENRPDITAMFVDFLTSLNPKTDTLYILGDFFDYWIGDDDPSTWLLPIKQALKKVSDDGIAIYFMVGNRDFAIGKRFCKACGMTLLSDPSIVKLYQQRILLMHGDILCTDDVSYQKFRRIIRNPIVLFVLRHLPLRTRHKIAQKLRQESQQKQSQVQMSILDVNTQAVAKCMDDWQVDLLIHGHTHRPRIHNHARATNRGTRIVLGDWYDQGSILELDEDGYSLFEYNKNKA